MAESIFKEHATRLLSKTLATWCFFSLMALFLVAIFPEVMIVPAVVTVIGMTYWCVQCAYRTEHFRQLANLRLFTNLGFAPVLAFIAMLGVGKQLNFSAIMSVALGCVPLVIAGLSYAGVYVWRSPKNLLRVRNGRVEVVEVVEVEESNHWAIGGFAAAIGSLLYPTLQAYGSPGFPLAAFFTGISLFMTFYHRASISSLRLLKEQEAREGCNYTFMNIEEIREERAASLIRRLFASKGGR